MEEYYFATEVEMPINIAEQAVEYYLQQQDED